MILADYADDGALSNNMTRPQNLGMAQFDLNNDAPLFTGDELVDLRSDDAMLSAGDLVELRCVSCIFILCSSPTHVRLLALRAQGGRWLPFA